MNLRIIRPPFPVKRRAEFRFPQVYVFSVAAALAGGGLLYWLYSRRRMPEDQTQTGSSARSSAKSSTKDFERNLKIVKKNNSIRSESPQRQGLGPDWDVIDQASWESFPASDPPAW